LVLTWVLVKFLTKDQLKIGSDLSGETFRVLKEKKEKQYSEYRTRRLVLEV